MSEEMGLSVKKSEDFGEWYSEMIKKAEVVDTRYGIKGFQVYLPIGMEAAKEITRLFEVELEKDSHKPVLFPVLIPESSLKKESEHIKGFEREVFWITHAGENKLEERACLRPTSETAMYPLYSLWIRSHMQLPLKLYQSVCVYRYETKMTRPLMRSREFLWIEAHTAQKTCEDSIKQVEEDMDNFKQVANKLCIPFVLLKRPQWDKFPGAVDTYAFETILPDGVSLQIGTTHHLGENFAKVFNIKYMDASKKKIYVDQTCFGIGISRILGGVAAIHGDDKGLVFPPSIAPIQVVIVPIYKKESKTEVLEKCGEILGKLKERGFRTYLDNREQYTPGFKFNEWELKGVPIRIEIGPKDIKDKKLSLVRRDLLARTVIDEDEIEDFIIETFDSISFNLLEKANELMLVRDAQTYDELKKKLKSGGFIRVPLCMNNKKCAEKIKEETGAEVRGTLFKEKETECECILCKKKAEMVCIAKAY